jgi:hypothetical protein
VSFAADILLVSVIKKHFGTLLEIEGASVPNLPNIYPGQLQSAL